jgi:hypothetical protein
LHFRQTPFLSNSRFGIGVEEMALIHIELDADIIPCGIIIRAPARTTSSWPPTVA